MSEEEWENDDLHPEVDYCKSMQEDSKNEMINEYLRSNRKDDEFETEMKLNIPLSFKIQNGYESFIQCCKHITHIGQIGSIVNVLESNDHVFICTNCFLKFDRGMRISLEDWNKIKKKKEEIYLIDRLLHARKMN